MGVTVEGGQQTGPRNRDPSLGPSPLGRPAAARPLALVPPLAAPALGETSIPALVEHAEPPAPGDPGAARTPPSRGSPRWDGGRAAAA